METSDLMAIIISVLSFALAIFSLFIAARYRKELDYSQQIGNYSNIFRENFSDRKFSSPTNVYRRSCTTLREAMAEVEQCIEDTAKGKANESEAIKKFQEASLDKINWQNSFAYELSLALDCIGIMVLAGALPLKLILSDAAKNIIKSWCYSSKLIMDKIGCLPLQGTGATKICLAGC